MTTAQDYIDRFQNILEINSVPIRFKYFTVSGAIGNYDDQMALAQSGNNFWTSGQVQPLDFIRGSKEALLIEQGKIKEGDKKLYVPGDTVVSGTWRLSIGSNTGEEYGLVPEGVNEWSIEGSPVYKKLYIRYLQNGSLTNE